MVQPDQVSCVCEPRFRSPASTPAGARAERQRRQQKPEQRRRPPLPLVPPGHATPPSCYLLARVATPPARFSCCISSLGAACYPFASPRQIRPGARLLTDLFPAAPQRLPPGIGYSRGSHDTRGS
ncbi:hypothetical protein SEVIR_7G112450v4 [Setaria viridis]